MSDIAFGDEVAPDDCDHPATSTNAHGSFCTVCGLALTAEQIKQIEQASRSRYKAAKKARKQRR